MADTQEASESMGGLNLDDSYLLVAAIDFGTTFSGYGFSLKSSPEEIHMFKNWGSEEGILSLKCPTAVLTDPNGSFLHFGYEAEREYIQHEPSEGYQLYRGYKMILHQKDISMDCTVKSACGHVTRALDIFAMSLKFLKDHLIETIKNTTEQSLVPADFRWVLTVPAIWTEEAKQFMRNAAFEAGLITEQNSNTLLFALEPEAASIYCRTLDVKIFTVGGSNTEAEFRTGDKMMIIDAGGGTVDIAAHEILITGDAKEIVQPSGGPWGGLRVNRKFVSLLSDVFGQDFITCMRLESPQQWVEFGSRFEIAKKSIVPGGKHKLRLSIPYEFNTLHRRVREKDVPDVVKEYPYQGINFSCGNLIFEPSLTQSFFEESCQKIVRHVKKLLKKPELEGLGYILLVGGYGESKVLLDACDKAFGRQCKVLVPLSAQTAIIQGAVLFGHQPTLISSRVATATYGCQADLLFDEKLHDPTRKYQSKRDGQLRCHGAFRIFVKVGEKIKNPVKSFTVHPKSKEEKYMFITILKSEKRDVLYCDEEGVSVVQHIKMKSAKKYYLGEDIDIRVTFGHTEILMEARDTKKGYCLVKTAMDYSSK